MNFEAFAGVLKFKIVAAAAAVHCNCAPLYDQISCEFIRKCGV